METYKNDLVAFRTSVRPLRSISVELREALEETNQFSIRYQPVIEGSTGRLEFAEALIRWTSPVLGEVLPVRFIYVAEQNGLIRCITRMVLRKVCDDISRFPGLVVSVNVSNHDITDPAFPDEVANTLAEYGVSPNQVILECTDSITPANAFAAAPIVEKLREQGHSVAIYELDTGFTTFGFLRMSGYTLLKVDTVLIDEALQNATSRENLQEALDDSKDAGFKSLAFGVEWPEQAALVTEMGFDLQQGFFHSMPLSLDELKGFSGRPANRRALVNA